MSKRPGLVEKIDSLGSPNIGKAHDFRVSLRYYATYVPAEEGQALRGLKI
jgi:hypothetical protein